jgi:hypothetical protein
MCREYDTIQAPKEFNDKYILQIVLIKYILTK